LKSILDNVTGIGNFLTHRVRKPTSDSNQRKLVTQCLLCPECRQTQQGHEYVGTLNTTVSGRTCQAWTSDSPHERTGVAKNYAFYPDVSLEAAENYCRNPTRRPEGVWCYTTDPDVRWEACDVPLCNLPGRFTLSISLYVI